MNDDNIDDLSIEEQAADTWGQIDAAEREQRAAACETCGHPLKRYSPHDTSTWREDNFCSARCKRRRKR